MTGSVPGVASATFTTTRSRLRFSPLAGSYGAAVAIALLALCPFIVLTTAAGLAEQEMIRDLGTGKLGFQLSDGLANALYAFGAVAAADLTKRISQRWLYMICEAVFAGGSALAALATAIVPFTAGRCLEGLATGMLLVVALPPLVTEHGAEKVPLSAAFINLGLFGMVTLGPILGGAAAAAQGWRVLFAICGAAALVGLVVGALGFRYTEPLQPGVGFDWTGIPVALAATVPPFVGVSFLVSGTFANAVFIAGVAVGVVALVALVVVQKRKARALMPVGPISHTLPVSGIIVAMAIGAAFVAMLELTEMYLTKATGHAPLAVGALVAPEVGGLVISAALFRWVLPTRWMPAFAFGAVLAVAAAAGLLLAVSTGDAGVLVPVAAALLGYGAGSGVAPGLFMAGLSVPATELGPTFALVELLRSEAAFLIVPVLVHVAGLSASVAFGFKLAVAIMLAVLLVTGLFALLVLLAGGARPHRPQLEPWLAGEHPAYDSPPFLARLRR
ncbi:MAG: MFS transporter [Solirubrobacteraceae bacterium]